jgi:para-nitrobenzyl esterase
MTEPTAVVEGGRIRGTAELGCARYLGVPYAAPPVGAQRFRAPEPAVPWSGTRDCTKRGPNAPQILRPFPNVDVAPLVGTGWRQGDEFLTADVWAPDTGARGLPVMVFIHGGAWVAGESGASVHAGAAFARAGIVYAAINYRLGVEGFLPIPGAPTNLGLRDQLAALAWVQRNAAAFGGDAGNVTVVGESAGAMSIACLIGSPLSQGLFRRAIVQSGHGAMVRAVPTATRVVAAIAERLGVSADLDGFANSAVERCLAAANEISLPGVFVDLRDDDGRDPTYGLTKFVPVYGDDVLPVRPIAALERGAGKDVELLIGSNREEMNLYFVPTGIKSLLTDVQASAALGLVEPKAVELLAAYSSARPGSAPGDVFVDAMTDLVFRLPVRRFAGAHAGRTHVYEFGWRSPALSGGLGACHGMELPFVFDTLATCTGPNGIAGTAPPQELADRVHRIWVEFASTGRLPWSEYGARSRQVHALETGRTGRDPDMPAERCLS